MFTYLIQAGCGDGPIKIGKAVRPRKRLRALQCGNAYLLTLVAVVEGDIECLLHRLCETHRLRGEWFRPECMGDLRELVDNPLLVADSRLYEVLEQFEANKKETGFLGRSRYECPRLSDAC